MKKSQEVDRCGTEQEPGGEKIKVPRHGSEDAVGWMGRRRAGGVRIKVESLKPQGSRRTGGVRSLRGGKEGGEFLASRKLGLCMEGEEEEEEEMEEEEGWLISLVGSKMVMSKLITRALCLLNCQRGQSGRFQ